MTVPDKWEFANDNFQRGQKKLLSKIHRRKPVISTAVQAALGEKSGGPSTPSNSGKELASTSSLGSKNSRSVETKTLSQMADLSGENEKLKRENENLNSELVQTKKQCDKLVGFVVKYVKMGHEQINRIIGRGSYWPTHDDFELDNRGLGLDRDGGDDDEEEKE